MPFSYSAQISTIVGFAEALNPLTVLDVGTGMGQYGFLLRTNLEGVNLFEIEGSSGKKRARTGWRVTIDGIEGFGEYLTPVHEYAYSQMLIGDALAILPKLSARTYDLVLAIDILEHFYRDDGKRFIELCLRACRRSLLVSTPKTDIPQDVPANPFENHRSHWTEAELREMGCSQILANDLSWIAVWNCSAD
jgi:hypothetical protein